MAKVFITGATGFVGSHIVDSLVAHGHRVEIIARKTSRTDFLPDNIVLHRCALCDPSPVFEKLTEAEYFIHIAGITRARRKQDYYDINGKSVKIWLDAVLAHCPNIKRFILIGSQAATRPSRKPIDENVVPAPLTDYGESKLLGERFAQDYMPDLPITIVRPPAVYGPRDRDIFFYFQMASRKIIPIVGNPERKFSLIYVKDLAEAVVLAMTHPDAVGEIFFVTDGDAHTWREFANEVARAIGGKKLRLRLPGIALWAAASVDETISFIFRKPALLSFQKVKELLEWWNADGTKMQRIIGFKPKFDLQSGVAETAQWYRENGWVK